MVEAPPVWLASSAGCSRPGPPQPSGPPVTSGPSWCERGPHFSAGSGAPALPARGRGGCAISCARFGSVCAGRADSGFSARTACRLGQALSRKGSKLGRESGRWPPSPGLRCKREAAPETSHARQAASLAPGLAVSTVCSTPAGGEGCHRVGGARPCSGPRKVPVSALQPGLGLESVARGLAAHRCPFPGVLGEESTGQHACQAQAQLQPTRGRRREALPLGPQGWASCPQPSPRRWPSRHGNSAASPTRWSPGSTEAFYVGGQYFKQMWTSLGTWLHYLNLWQRAAPGPPSEAPPAPLGHIPARVRGWG